LLLNNFIVYKTPEEYENDLKVFASHINENNSDYIFEKNAEYICSKNIKIDEKIR
jgi:hypothetical protein